MADTVKQSNWLWEGKDRQGKRVSGRLAASTMTMARAELRRQGIAANRIHRERAPRGKRIKPNDIAYLSRQLATMLGAGVPVVQAFNIIATGHENPRMRQLTNQIRQDIEGGASLSLALSHHPKYFDELYINLVSAGEQSGTLDSLLERIADYKEKTESIKQKIRKAMFYPAMVVLVAVIVTAILLIYVIPKFKSLYSNFGASLPAFTRWVIGVSNSVTHEGWLYALIIIGAVIGVYQARQRSEAFRHRMDRWLLKLPVLGLIMTKAAIARFARTLSITFKAGVPLNDGLVTVAGATGNSVFREAVDRARVQISGGQRLYRALEETNVFPNIVTQMVAIGEESGELDIMTGKVADFYEQEVDTLVDGLSSLLEPLIMMILGVVVGGLVIAMYLPIFNMGNVV